jgi:hypothetical protein
MPDKFRYLGSGQRRINMKIVERINKADGNARNLDGILSKRKVSS